MATNFNGLRGTKEVLDAIVAKVAALLWKGEKAFQNVELFDVTDIMLALQTIIAARDRIAVIVFDTADFESQPNGTDLVCKQTRRIDVIVSDRVINADRRKAVFGEGDHPGVLALQDLVIEQVSGLLLENPKGVYLAPVGAEPVIVTDAAQKNHPGRRAAVVNFEARGGLLTKDLGKGPIQ